jgi:hypothetical protein
MYIRGVEEYTPIPEGIEQLAKYSLYKKNPKESLTGPVCASAE